METWKDVFSLLGAIVGLLTAVIPLVARLIDRKKQAAPANEPAEVPRTVIRPRPAAARAAAVEVVDEPVWDALPAGRNPRQVERARALVKGPAIALLVAGFLGLVFNLVVAVFGFVDEFITPLNTESQQRARMQTLAAMPVADRPPAVESGPKGEKNDPATTMLTIVMLLSFAVACVMAIWAGFHMINLRSYWLSMAGSFAVMPGTCFCCLIGLPLGVWSLAVLLNPEVRSTFQ